MDRVARGDLAPDVFTAQTGKPEIENDGADLLLFDPLKRIEAVFGCDDV